MTKKNKVIVDKNILDKYISERANDLSKLHEDLQYAITPLEAMQAIAGKMPIEQSPVVINPVTTNQMSEPLYPIEDREWAPGNRDEFKKAILQLSDRIPDKGLKYVWMALKKIIAKLG